MSLSGIEVLDNRYNKPIDDVLTISYRDNNKKRPYLILNKLQGKYNPTLPSDALDMFQALANQIVLPNDAHNILVVGFAETATAIGAEVAATLLKAYPKKRIIFQPTTRENYDASAVKFTEDHSHAVDQILYISEDALLNIDHIVFVEDEVTTGNTICHCVEQLNSILPYNKSMAYTVAALMNCMDKEETERFTMLHITPIYLYKTDKGGFSKYKTRVDKSDTPKKSAIQSQTTHYTRFNKLSDVRLGVEMGKYMGELGEFIYEMKKELIPNIPIHHNSIPTRILFIGTEECMYPALKLAEAFEANGYVVNSQATTRVPICVHDVPNEDTMFNRYDISSAYSNERQNYIYNVMNNYDVVVLVTDGTRGVDELEELYAPAKVIDIRI